MFYAGTEEIGCREVKVVDEDKKYDRTRIAETMKRQLNIRIMKSKQQKEMMTLGCFLIIQTLNYILSLLTKMKKYHIIYIKYVL